MFITSLAIFPVGFGEAGVRDVCGLSSDVYAMGNCVLGWSYYLSILGTILCSILPVLSHYVLRLKAISNEMEV